MPFGAFICPAPSAQSASKQSSWDQPSLLADSVAVEEARTSLENEYWEWHHQVAMQR